MKSLYSAYLYLVVVLFLLSSQHGLGFDSGEMKIIASELQNHMGEEWVVLPIGDEIKISQNQKKNAKGSVGIVLRFTGITTDSYLELSKEKFSLWLKLFEGFSSKDAFQKVADRFDEIDLPEYVYFGAFVDVKGRFGDGSEKKEIAEIELFSKLDTFFQILPKFDDWMGR